MDRELRGAADERRGGRVAGMHDVVDRVTQDARHSDGEGQLVRAVAGEEEVIVCRADRRDERAVHSTALDAHRLDGHPARAVWVTMCSA